MLKAMLLAFLVSLLATLVPACERSPGSADCPPVFSGTYSDVHGLYLTNVTSTFVRDGEEPVTEYWGITEVNIQQTGPGVTFFDRVGAYVDGDTIIFPGDPKLNKEWHTGFHNGEPPFFSLLWTGSGDLGGIELTLRIESFSIEGNLLSGITEVYTFEAFQPIDLGVLAE